MSIYHIEITDTFGGEANYCWKNEYLVHASSFRGAISRLARDYGAGWRLDYDCGDMARYNLRGACVCAFVSWTDSDQDYSHIPTIN
jgi:hypothetical protein